VLFPLAVGLLAAFPATAQEEQDQAIRLDPVVVTVTRTEQRAGDAPADVTVLTRQDIDRSPSQALDDLLRQVPGFSLFRRTSSLVGNPTTQGVSLRGIGPSGTSRALVLLDGVPINDPFGGWVYWDRIPLQGVEQVEVVRGGGSSAWGNYALGGVINIITRKPVERAALFDGSYGNHNTFNLDGIVSEVQGPFRLGLEGNYFNTDGYPIVKQSDRGRIDINATSQHSTFNGRVELVLSPDLSFYLRGNHYDEDRGNGTPLQNNDTEAGSFATGGRLRTGDGSDWSFSLRTCSTRRIAWGARATASSRSARRYWSTAAFESASARAMIRAHLLRWRPRPHAQRRETTPRVRPSGAPRSWPLLLALAGFLRQAPRAAIRAHLRRCGEGAASPQRTASTPRAAAPSSPRIWTLLAALGNQFSPGLRRPVTRRTWRGGARWPSERA